MQTVGPNPPTLQRAKAHEVQGDAKLAELLAKHASCPKARAASAYDRCGAVYNEGLEVS
jgi:hypothetical protein